jgi:hypothetical protein
MQTNIFSLRNLYYQQRKGQSKEWLSCIYISIRSHQLLDFGV